MDMKKIIHSIRLVIADEERDQTQAIDELLLPQVEEARQLLSVMRGHEVLKGVVALRQSGLSFTADLKPKTIPLDQQPAKLKRFGN